MGVLATILYIVLFLLFLSLLVLIHELGHFAMCKAFKVYVFEFSIGMGPLLFKRKKGETQYSIRGIPFGGYVSMYDGEQTLPEGLEIDPARSMENTKKWKRAIIFVKLFFLISKFNHSGCDKDSESIEIAQSLNRHLGTDGV